MSGQITFRSILIGLLGIIFITGGCAPTKVPFYYEHPAPTDGSEYGTSLYIVPINDVRVGLTDIDEVFTEPPCQCLNRILFQEMESTGLFASVEPMTVQTGEMRALTSEESPVLRELMMTVELRDLEWHVPDYDTIQSVANTSASFGLIGGVVALTYLSTDTDAFGRTVVAVEVQDASTGDVLLSNEYVGRAKEVVTKGECDVYETKSRLVGKSAADAIRQLKADLEEIVPSLLQPRLTRADTTYPGSG